MGSLSQSRMRCAAVLTMIGCVAAALAEAPVPTQDVLDLFSQRASVVAQLRAAACAIGL